MSFQQRHEVLFLNNVGVSYLRNGEIDNAMHSLTQALAAVRQCGEAITTTASTTNKKKTKNGVGQSQQQQQQQGIVVDDNVDIEVEEDKRGEEQEEEEELDLEQYFCNIIEWTSSSGCATTSTAGNPINVQPWQQQQHVQHQIAPCSNDNVVGGFTASTKGLYIYSSPLELPIDDDTSIVYKVQCITILFNLAMSFQLRAYQEEQEASAKEEQQQQQQLRHQNAHNRSHSSSSYHDLPTTATTTDRAMSLHMYENAIALYELCYDVLNGGTSSSSSAAAGPRTSSSQPSSSTGAATAAAVSSSTTRSRTGNCYNGTINPGLYFMMILTNNLGQCHYSLHNHEKSRTCFEQLLSIQMYIVDSFGGDCETDIIETTNTIHHGPQPASNSYIDCDFDDNDTPMMEASTATATTTTTTTTTSATSSSRSTSSSNPTNMIKYNNTNNNDEDESHNTSTTNLTPWEGFLNNTSRIVILSKRCASAA